MTTSPGKKFRDAVIAESPLQIVGAINAYCAMMAEQSGFKALYLSGGGVAYSSNGLPDLGITNLNDVINDAWRITSTTDCPLLVDIDTGFGHEFSIERTIKQMIKAGVAAVHIEDQVAAKRCGHRPKKALVDGAEMVARIKAAVDAKTDFRFQLGLGSKVAWIEYVCGDDFRVKRNAGPLPSGQSYIDIADAPPEQFPSDSGVKLSIYSDPSGFMEIEACGGCPDTLVPGTELSVNIMTEYRLNDDKP